MKSGYICSSIGKKQVMAISGLAWCGFVLSHMLGNLLYLVSASAYNQYGNAITSNKPVYYTIEVGLLITFLVHVIFAIWVSIENSNARPVAYAVSPSGKGAASFASKTMKYSGILIFVFLILHLIKFRFGTYYPFDLNGAEVRDLHRLMTEAFLGAGYTAWYLICLTVLGFHLSHALWSSLQTLSLLPSGKEKMFSCLSSIFGWAVAIGFALNPIIIYMRGE
ncbi:MAG: succinate dehydrogenase cytochrome b subunit [Oligoflexia bacterium]|nr:succinate dehydrogenase cytochrome b subunit [Oligoflexia bacterium]